MLHFVKFFRVLNGILTFQREKVYDNQQLMRRDKKRKGAAYKMYHTYNPYENVVSVMTEAMEKGNIDKTMFEIIKNP